MDSIGERLYCSQLTIDLAWPSTTNKGTGENHSSKNMSRTPPKLPTGLHARCAGRRQPADKNKEPPHIKRSMAAKTDDKNANGSLFTPQFRGANPNSPTFAPILQPRARGRAARARRDRAVGASVDVRRGGSAARACASAAAAGGVHAGGAPPRRRARPPGRARRGGRPAGRALPGMRPAVPGVRRMMCPFDVQKYEQLRL